MRIAYDYGMGISLPGYRPARPSDGAHTESVVIIRLNGEDSKNPAGSAGEDTRSKNSDHIPVPGTNLYVTDSNEAKIRDHEVRAHENAHMAALGPYAASGIMLDEQSGVGGGSFAVAGAVKVDLAPVPGDPDATLRKAQAVIRAAFAPGEPSAADRRVAADAYRLAQQAKDELRSGEWWA